MSIEDEATRRGYGRVCRSDWLKSSARAAAARQHRLRGSGGMSEPEGWPPSWATGQPTSAVGSGRPIGDLTDLDSRRQADSRCAVCPHACGAWASRL